MLGIISMFLSLQAIGLGACATGAGMKSWFHKIEEQNRRQKIKVKQLHHGWSVQVKEAYYDKQTGLYYGYVRCEIIDRNIHVTGKTEEELRLKIDAAIAQLGEEYDRWKSTHLPWL